MVQPINYMAQMPQIDLAERFGSGFRLGAGIREARQAQEQQKLDQQRIEQYSSDLQNTLSNPTAQGFAALSAKYPQQREAFKQSWEMLDSGQKDAEFRVGVQAFNALSLGQPDVAKQLVDEQIVALENSGRDATNLKTIRSSLDADPQAVTGSIGLILSSVDPDRWGKIAGEMRSAQKAPAELTEAQAKAQKAAVEAKFAESGAALDLEKKGWDIQKVQADMQIARQNANIAALNASIARESNDLKRNELLMKLDDKQKERDSLVRGKVAEVETARGNFDQLLGTTDKILKFSDDVFESATGPISTMLPTISQDTADFEETIGTLGSQVFLSQVEKMKGLGALTESEGKRLEVALGSVSLRQSPKQLKDNLREIQRLTQKARTKLAEKYGVPDTIPDTPTATPAMKGMTTDDMLRELGVM